MKTLAVTGKGGVGKTTLAALLVKLLSSRKIILAVDADPNTNLNIYLGVEVEKSIGELREEIVENPDDIPNGMSKQEWIQYQLRMAIIEGSRFDLIAMGRQEGPGCYCYINNLLRVFMDSLAEKYPYVVIDNEAGMEHLSRRTTKAIHYLFIVSDATRVGLMTAQRIAEMPDKLDIQVDKKILLINRTLEIPAYLEGSIGKNKFDHVETLPEDPMIREFVDQGKPLIDLPDASQAFVGLKQIVTQLSI